MLAVFLLGTLALLGALAAPLVQDTRAAVSPSAQDVTRARDIQLLERAWFLSVEAPAAAVPALEDLILGSSDQDVRERAAELLLDTITRNPGCSNEGLEPTLRNVYVNAQDEQLRQRALLFLLGRQVDELPPGAQGAFLKAILPQVISAARRHQLPPSVTLAQAVHESGWGRSRLATEHHNLFGVKAGKSHRAVTMPTREHQEGATSSVRSRFRTFTNLGESIEHHATLLAQDRRYAQAHGHWADWRAFLARMAPTYATDPSYAAYLAVLVDRYELDRWDSLVRDGAVHDLTS